LYKTTAWYVGLLNVAKLLKIRHRTCIADTVLCTKLQHLVDTVVY